MARIKFPVSVIVIPALAFVSGLAIGQKANTSKFEKYLQPKSQKDFDLIALQATIANIRAFMPLPDEIGMPQVRFDAKNDRPEAVVSVLPDVEKLPTDKMRNHIRARYYLTYYALKQSMPDLSQDDFVLHVVRNPPVEPNRQMFAECQRGTVTFF